MLFNFLTWFFKEFIYSRHEHTWVFDRTEKEYGGFGGIDYIDTLVIYKCSTCDRRPIAIKKTK